MALGIAFRAFFSAIFSAESADRIERALAKPEEGQRTALPAASGVEGAPAKESAAREMEKRPAARSDALTLLATLQREARLLDLIQEPLDQFNDAQIGAAAREVLKDARQTLDRLFAIEPLSEVDEGDKLAIAGSLSPNRLRLVGKSSGDEGTVTHRGWTAKRCEIPHWNGSRDDALVLAPTEVEVG
jgi:hypothetical protein